MAGPGDAKPLELSRYCVPFTPFEGRVEEARICLVSTAGVRHKDDRPFEVEGDTSWRVIPGASPGADLRYDDAHYDHGCVDADIGCVFPLDRLRELRERTIPALVREIDRERPGAVLLTGG